MRGDESTPRAAMLYVWLAAALAVWTSVLFGLYAWSCREERIHFARTVELKATALARHAQALRRWVGGHGGVYVEVADGIEPHPLLDGIAERDLRTPSGRQLTLLNSPALLRLISKEFESEGGDTLRLTSRRPLNPANAADPWELEALESLEAGAAGVGAFVATDAGNAYRLAWPIRSQPNCLRCHHYPADRLPALVGALSVTVDKTPYDRMSDGVIRKLTVGYAVIWGLGAAGILAFGWLWGRLFRRIELAATHDALTQLNNRREITRLLKLEYVRARRYGRPLQVMMLDIDHFKRVNDTHGHAVGDDVLRKVGETLSRTVRETDSVGRYGGEEFVVLMPDAADEGSLELAERLRAEVKSASVKTRRGERVAVSLSIGVAALSPSTDAPDRLLEAADAALYRAKAGGRDCVRFAGRD